MAEVCGFTSFNISGDMINVEKKFKDTEELALLLNSIGMKDRDGRPVRWYARQKPGDNSQVILLTVTNSEEEAYEIADTVLLSGLVTKAQDITIMEDPPLDPDNTDSRICRIVILPRKINRPVLESYVAGNKKAAPRIDGPYTFH